jgi:hypothetical protein
MITVLDRPLRRLVTIQGEPHVVTISPDGVRVIPKGKRKGPTIPWQDIVSGGVTLDAQLVGSLKSTGHSAAAAERTAPAESGRRSRRKVSSR